MPKINKPSPEGAEPEGIDEDRRKVVKGIGALVGLGAAGVLGQACGPNYIAGAVKPGPEGSNGGPEGCEPGPEGCEPEGSLSCPEGCEPGPEGSRCVPEGCEPGPEGCNNYCPEGSVPSPEGSRCVPEGSNGG